MELDKIQQALNADLCRSVRLHKTDKGLVMIDNPFTFPDGDHFSLYLSPTSEGKYKLSDLANTAMRLSYEEDVEKFFSGDRVQHKLLRQILQETNVQEKDGEFFIETDLTDLAQNILSFSQTLTSIYDLSFLNKDRKVASFSKNLEEMLNFVPSRFIHKKYHFACDEKQSYPVDYYLENPEEEESNLCVYGIHNNSKAQLVTIILQFLQTHGESRNNLLVFRDRSSISKKTLERLFDVGEKQERIDKLSTKDELRSTVKRMMNGHASFIQ